MTVNHIDDLKFVAFDLESAVPYPEGHEIDIWQDDVGISIIATETYTGVLTSGVRQLWYSRNAAGLPAKRMAAHDLLNFLKYLEEMTALGAPALSWNGQGFDFPLLGIEITKNMTKPTALTVWRRIRKLSAAHYDPMLQAWWKRGYPIGLDATGRGLGCGRKLKEADGEEVSGASAAELWQKGVHGLVMLYVAADAALTASIAREVLAREHQGLIWYTRKGAINFVRFVDGLRTVAEVYSYRAPARPLMSPLRAFDWWTQKAPDPPDPSTRNMLEALETAAFGKEG